MSEQTITDRALQFLKPILPPRFRGDVPIVPIVRLSGIIGISSPLRPGLTLSGTARTLDRAFKTRHARAVALLINSPGGSAVQSHLIFKRIRQLSEENELPVIAFVEDVAASGGYMIACAADEIIADTTSIVGSIGVVGGSFGFDKLLRKIGVERRLYTSGEHKAMLDPFLPEKPDDVQRLKAIQDEIHKFFIELVRERRGAVLIGPEDQLYSGEFWTGARGRELGLVDHIGDIRSTLRERFGDDVLMPLIAAERTPFWRRRLGFEAEGRLGFEAEGRLGFEAEGMGLARDLISALEARAIWARFGL